MRLPALLPSENQFYSEGLPAGASVPGGAFETATGSRCYFSFIDIETLVLLNRGRVQAQGYSHIVAIARGGLYAGAMLSQFTGTPMSVSTFDRTSRTVRCDLGAPSVPDKACAILTHGVSEFVESELTHAQEIAQRVPYCVVWHYDARSHKLTRCS